MTFGNDPCYLEEKEPTAASQCLYAIHI